MCIGVRRYFSLMEYQQRNGAALALVMMQGEFTGTFDAALNPAWRYPAVSLEKEKPTLTQGDFGDLPHAYFKKLSRNQLKTKN